MTSDLPLPRVGVTRLPGLRVRVRVLTAQIVSFGAVGGLAFVVDAGVYNLLRFTFLEDKPIGAKVISVTVATVVAWIGNRYLTFRSERHHSRRAVVREAAVFGAINVVGLLIAMACLFVSHYLLGFTSTLADNIAGNIVGLMIGMIFRFLAYRMLVFRRGTGRSTPTPTPTAERSIISLPVLEEGASR